VTTNPLLGVPQEPESSWAGIWIAEDIELIARGVENGSWVDGTLGGVGAGLDALAVVSDPLGALLQYGIAWLVEHIRPLAAALDWLAGDPAQISAQAQTWRNVASSVRTEFAELTEATRRDVSEWQGAAATAYRTWASRRNQSLQALARSADVVAVMTEGAGMLVGTVRLMVRDAVATVVSRLTLYAAELVATAGFATPLIAEQVGALCASWAAKIAAWLKSLLASIRNLLREGGKLAELVSELNERLRRKRPSAPVLHREGDGILRNGKKILMTEANVAAVAEKYGIDLRGVDVVIDKARSGSGPGRELYGITTTDGRVTLTRDAFADEEQLARTLAHELFHVEEIRTGLTVPRNPRKIAQWERRAEAYEEQWWRDHCRLLEE